MQKRFPLTAKRRLGGWNEKLPVKLCAIHEIVNEDTMMRPRPLEQTRTDVCYPPGQRRYVCRLTVEGEVRPGNLYRPVFVEGNSGKSTKPAYLQRTRRGWV